MEHKTRHMYPHIDDITFNTRGDAQSALDKMHELIKGYGCVSVADVCDLAGISPRYTDYEYGWTNIDGAKIVVHRWCGYFINMSCDPIYLFEHGEEEEEQVCDKLPFESKSDMVNHPQHYISNTGLEVIDVIEAFTCDLKGIEATDTGNIIKYICRWKNKNGLQDLEKCRWYIDHLINHVKETEKEN